MLTPEEREELDFLDEELSYLEQIDQGKGTLDYYKMCKRFSELRNKLYQDFQGSNVQGGESGLHPD